MADVFLALARGPAGFNKLVVIKRLRSHLADDPDFHAMLIDEARLAARLNHPNIVHTNEVGEVDGRFFMAMEYLEGQPLTRVKRRSARQDPAPLSFNAEVRIIRDVLDGLQHAHDLTDYDGTRLNVVHRDVTPSNIFISYDGAVKILDFGIAKATGRSSETKTGVVKGKMTYMPPEQAVGRVDIDGRADVYSAGVMLWEAATGQRMWKGLEDVVILGKLIHGDVKTSPKEVNPEIDDEIDRICQKALAPEPAERYENASAFASDLEAYLRSQDEVPTNRDLGKTVSSLFSKERDEIKRIIEDQLARLKDSPHSLAPAHIQDISPASLTPSSHSVTDISLRARSGRLDSVTSISVTGSTEGRDSRSEKTTRRPWLGVAAAALALIAVVVWRTGGSTQQEAGRSRAVPNGSEPTARPAVPASMASSSVTQSNSVAGERVQITLRATPPEAEFRIDGGRALTNPYLGHFTKDENDHQIVVSAEGYESKTIDVTFDRDLGLDVPLKREKKARPRRRAQPPPPRPEPVPEPQPEPPSPLPAPRVKPKPELIDGDPWGKE